VLRVLQRFGPLRGRAPLAAAARASITAQFVDRIRVGVRLASKRGMSRACSYTHQRQRNRGFTLVEVVIAIGLLIALCAGASMLLTLSLATIDRSRQRTMEMVLARSKLEQLLSASPGVDDVDYPDSQGQVYTRRWSIEHRGSGAAELLIVQVLVTPRGRGDREGVWISGARLRRGA
jgi:prepilin-type N-terminal cleavage/methylation domain-containing protein